MPTTEQLPPNYSKLDTALRSIGYSFESAVADIIDNSIDAGAKNILVRLIQKKSGGMSFAVFDDGCGMTYDSLREAMRFGADVSEELGRLGKFGLGLKLASLSQAKAVTVISRHKGELSARAWLEDGIKNGFRSTNYSASEAEALLAQMIPDKELRTSGTLVYWSDLYRVGYHHKDADEHAEKLAEKLQDKLRLAFHRFLSSEKNRLNIVLDVFREDTSKEGIPYSVTPLNPFGYQRGGCDGYPKQFKVRNTFSSQVKIVAHIWPPNSEIPEYKLPGGANARQGFYVYRNNRLIQAGGWNGLRDADPHMSLARIEIDVDPRIDLELSLDVKKSEIQLPPALLGAIEEATSADGTEFSEYLSTANHTYRSRSVTEKELPLVPAEGFPSEMRDILLKKLKLPQTSRHRKINVTWGDLEKHLVFWVDRDTDTLILNKMYRRHLLHGMCGSATDIPALKCLLFLIVSDAFKSERMGGKIKQKLELANLMLRQAVKYERRSK